MQIRVRLGFNRFVRVVRWRRAVLGGHDGGGGQRESDGGQQSWKPEKRKDNVGSSIAVHNL